MTTFVILVGICIFTFSLELLDRTICFFIKDVSKVTYLWLVLLVVIGFIGGSIFGINLPPKEMLHLNLTIVTIGMGVIILLSYYSKYNPGVTTKGIVQFCMVFPVGEEILFRGIIQSMVSWIPRFGVMYLRLPLFGTHSVVVLISAFLFAINHLQYHDFKLTDVAIRQIFIAFIGGLLMGNLVLYTGSILYALVVHILFNSSATLFSVLKKSGDTNSNVHKA